MRISEIQEKIVRLKREKDVCVLAHSYQSRAVVEIADIVGDSFALSEKAAKDGRSNALMCGVRFMAETVKILSPQKRVFLSSVNAGCPMAEQMDIDLINSVKAQNPGYAVVAYINTTAELKTVCDVCVTSSSAVKIVNAMEEKNIIFIPDVNLGHYVAGQVKDKNIKLLQGGCPIHARVDTRDVKNARAAHPNALLLVHPECVPAVVGEADYCGSTAGIMDFAARSEQREFIIGTETSIAEHLSYEHPHKRFYPLSKDLICPNMKLTGLTDVLHILENIDKKDNEQEIILSGEIMSGAKRCIDRMLALG